MDKPWLWIVIAAAVLIGIWRPRLLLTIICVLFAVAVTGLCGVFMLMAFSRFFGSKK
jgi:hypothetical protein